MMAKRITNRFSAFITDVNHRAIKGMAQAMVLGTSESAVMTPIDTGTLLNSLNFDFKAEGDKIKGVATYTAEYALPVHDPNNPQDFHRLSAEKSFLTKGFESAEPSIRKVLIDALKV